MPRARRRAPSPARPSDRRGERGAPRDAAARLRSPHGGAARRERGGRRARRASGGAAAFHRPADAHAGNASTPWRPGLEQIAALPDPVGEAISRWRRPNGLEIAQVRVPLGVIGIDLRVAAQRHRRLPRRSA